MAEVGNPQVKVGPPKFAGLPASQSVKAVAKKLSPFGPVTSWEVVKALLDLRPEYGKGMGKDLLRAFPPVESGVSSAFQGEPRTVSEWLEAVAGLYNPAVEFLDGRMVIIGLTMIDPNLGEFIARRAPNFIESLRLEGEREKFWGRPFDDLLIRSELGPDGKPQPEPEPPPPPQPPSEYDPAVQHDDSPAQKDVLGRSGFAEALAIWLTRLWEKNQPAKTKARVEAGNSFIMNIYGPWGSGKSSLLNLLKLFLQPPPSGQGQVSEKVQGWVVAEFNAWQHQHLTPVWWPLLDQVYQNVVQQLAKNFQHPSKAWKIRLREYSWRFFIGRKIYLFTFFVCFLAFQFFMVGPLIWPQISNLFANISQAEPLVKILVFLGALWSGILALSRSLLPGSVSSAEMFQQFTRDPLERVKQHYHRLLKQSDFPVMVFIDDLDRCQTNYVVKLLEGIQTLFNSSKVFYVIAADRRWLHRCFETEYQSLADSVLEPGRRMGHLFLEKVFQLAVPVPRLSKRYQEVYLDYLIRGDKKELNRSLEKFREQAAEEFNEARSQEEIIERLKSSPENSAISAIRDQDRREEEIIRDQARREAAIRQSASQDVEASTEYYLRNFASLLEPNPRAMKRLVTAYGIYRAQAMLEDLSLIDSEAKRDQFVLWIILRLRWPLLEEYLMKDSDKIEALHNYYVQKVEIAALDKELQPLATNVDVRRVLTGDKNGDKGVKLDKDALSNLIRLKE